MQNQNHKIEESKNLIDHELSQRKQEIDDAFHHCQEITSMQKYFILISALNIEGFTNDCIEQITSYFKANPSLGCIGIDHLNLKVLSFLSRYKFKMHDRRFESPEIKFAHDFVNCMNGNQYQDIKRMNFSQKQWEKLLDIYSLNYGLEFAVKESIKAILNKRNSLAHGNISDTNITKKDIKKFKEHSIPYLETVANNTKNIFKIKD